MKKSNASYVQIFFDPVLVLEHPGKCQTWTNIYNTRPPESIDIACCVWHCGLGSHTKQRAANFRSGFPYTYRSKIFCIEIVETRVGMSAENVFFFRATSGVHLKRFTRCRLFSKSGTANEQI